MRKTEVEAAEAATAHTEASTQWREERRVLQDAVYQAQQQVRSQGLKELCRVCGEQTGGVRVRNGQSVMCWLCVGGNI